MDKKEIIEKFPSLCYKCKRARKPVSEDFVQKGYVGCTLFAEEHVPSKSQFEIVSDIESEEQYTGWVYLKQGIFQEKVGFMGGTWFNDQLMTVKTSKCSFYEVED